MSPTKSFSEDDINRFAILKQGISDGMAVCFIVGAALREVKEKEYFRIDGYDTWQAFIDVEYGWTKRYCNQLIVDADAINSLPTSLRKLITTHKAAQALAQIPEGLRGTVVEEAAKSAKPKQPITAAAIKKHTPPLPKPKAKTSSPVPSKSVKAAAQSPPKKKQPRDETGLEIPVEIEQNWLEASDVAQGLITYSLALMTQLKKHQEAKTASFIEVDFTDNIAKLNQVTTDLRRSKPYAVCYQCQGKTPAGCTICKGRGYISKFLWDLSDETIKNLRK